MLYCIGWDLCPSYGHEHVLYLQLKYSHIFADVRQETNNYVRDYDVHVLLLSLLKYRWIPTFPKHFDLLGELVWFLQFYMLSESRDLEFKTEVLQLKKITSDFRSKFRPRSNHTWGEVLKYKCIAIIFASTWDFGRTSSLHAIYTLVSTYTQKLHMGLIKVEGSPWVDEWLNLCCLLSWTVILHQLRVVMPFILKISCNHKL